MSDTETDVSRSFLWNGDPSTLPSLLGPFKEELCRVRPSNDTLISKGYVTTSRGHIVVADPYHLIVVKHNLLGAFSYLQPYPADRDHKAVLAAAGLDPDEELAKACSSGATPAVANATPATGGGTPAPAGPSPDTPQPAAPVGPLPIQVQIGPAGAQTPAARSVTAASFEMNSTDRQIYMINPHKLGGMDRELQLDVLSIIQDRVDREIVRSADNLADFFTKPLPSRQFFALRDRIMNIQHESTSSDSTRAAS